MDRWTPLISRGAFRHPRSRAGDVGPVAIARGFTLGLVMSLLLVHSGCTTSSETVSTQRRHKFIRTQSENQVTLQWEGRPGQIYSVLYATDLNRPGGWRPVPGYETYLARDATTRITFTSPVPGAKVYYRLEEMTARR